VEQDGDLSGACGSNTGLVRLRDVDLGPITTGDTTNLIIGEPVTSGDLITSGDTCLFPTIGGLNRFAGLLDIVVYHKLSYLLEQLGNFIFIA